MVQKCLGPEIWDIVPSKLKPSYFDLVIDLVRIIVCFVQQVFIYRLLIL